MPYDEGLAQRIREELATRADVTEMTMFGGVGFLINGNMAVGIIKEDLIVRAAAKDNEVLLAEAHTRPMDFSGRPLKGWVYVGPAGYESDGDLREWIQRGVAYAQSLPPKQPGVRR